MEIDGVSPPIVDSQLWHRIQDILADPDRPSVRPTVREYVLRGRARCGVCGAPMIGQTLKARGVQYPYYRCRHLYDKGTSRACSSRYVRADDLEEQVWSAVLDVLSDPQTVLQELGHQEAVEADPNEAERIQTELASLEARERRLVRLFSYGEVDEALVREEGAAIRRQKQVLLDRLDTIAPRRMQPSGAVTLEHLARVCERVAERLRCADSDLRRLALEALQVTVTATRTEAAVTGIIPLDDAAFLTGEHSPAPGCAGTARGGGRRARRTAGPPRSGAPTPARQPAPGRRRRWSTRLNRGVD